MKEALSRYVKLLPQRRDDNAAARLDELPADVRHALILHPVTIGPRCPVRLRARVVTGASGGSDHREATRS
jgi:hypothetical protein